MATAVRSRGPRLPRAIRLRGIGQIVCALWLVLSGTGVGSDELAIGRTADHLTAQKRRTAAPPAYAPVDVAWVATLPTPQIRTVPDLAAISAVEEHAVTLAGYIVRVMAVPVHLGRRQATEWEFHLHLRVAPAERCEYRDDPRNVVAVVTPAFQPPHSGWDFDVLADLCRSRTRVQVSGWLLYDYVSRPQVGRSRVSPWSIHPVTQMEVWNAREQDWNRLR